MKLTSFAHLAKSVTAVALVIGTASVFVGASTEPAFANNGNGNGNGNNKANRGDHGRNAERGNGRTNRSADVRGNGNGRGAIASELKGLNAAHANPTAMANAAPNSMPGKLNTYRDERLALVAVVEDQNEAYDAYQSLAELSDEDIATEFPDGDYANELAKAEATYLILRNEAVIAQNEANESLLTLTGGRELSEAAILELHDLLGL